VTVPASRAAKQGQPAGECLVPVYSNTPVSTIFCEITVQKS
jgi:hypothetical protein